MSEYADQAASINHHHNATNTLSNDDFYKHISDTAEYIYNVLIDHCGPYATDALIVQDNEARSLKDKYYSIFTKDGINIVKSIQFASPIQRHIQELIAYVGERVDSLSHDGTTTSMLFFSGLIEDFMYLVDSKLKDGFYDRVNLKKSINDTLLRLNDKMKSSVITVEQLATDYKISPSAALSYVAFCQAMISTKGDVELSRVITEVVETLPKEFYGLFTILQSGIETENRFTVIRDTSNFILPVVVNIDDMNSKLGTEYFSDDCDIVVSEDDLVRGNAALDILMQLLFHATSEGLSRDLVVLCKSLDSQLMTQISEINRKSTHKIVVMTVSQHNQYSSKITVLNAIMNTAGIYTMGVVAAEPEKNCVIRGATLHFKNRRLYISDLYVKDPESKYHPFYNDPTLFAPYTKMVTEIKQELDVIISGKLLVESASDKVRYEDYVTIYRRMICSDIRDIQLSGMRHDILSDRDILQDAMGSVLSSLDHGFVFDGYLTMFTNLFLNNNDEVQTIFCNTLYDILTVIHKKDCGVVITSDNPDDDLLINLYKEWYSEGKSPSLFEDAHPEISYPYSFANRITKAVILKDSMLSSKYAHYPIDHVPLADIHASVLDFTAGRPMTRSMIPVMQPADTYFELFRRMHDLLPKIVNTSRAIIPNTINDRDE